MKIFSEAEGRSRTGISTAALPNFLCLGLGSFFWGALSDRLATRTVVLLGGALLGLGTVMASRVSTLGEFQLFFGVIVGFAAGSLSAPLTATTTRWSTQHRSLAVALVSAGPGLPPRCSCASRPRRQPRAFPPWGTGETAEKGHSSPRC